MDGAGDMRGWQWLFLLEGIPSLVMGVVFLLMLADRPERRNGSAMPSVTSCLRRLAEEEALKGGAGERHGIAQVFADWRVWVFGVVYFTGALCLYTTNFWMPTLISEFGIASSNFLRVGLLSMIPWGVTAIVQVLWAWNSDRTGERRWHTAGGFAMCVVGMVMLALIDGSPVLQLAALTLVTCGALCWVVAFWSIPTSFLSGARRGAGSPGSTRSAISAGISGPT